jgi:hypothetical protein
MLCLECSGYHRKMGAFSRIKSLKLDVTEPRTLKTFMLYGNDVVNGIMEGNIGDSHKPTPNAEGKDKEIWIRQKYMERRYLDTEKLKICP